MRNKECFDLNNLTIKEVMSPAEAYAKVKESHEKGVSHSPKHKLTIDECLMDDIRNGEVPTFMSPGVMDRYFALKKQYDASKKGVIKG